jgi:hypothetical protein
MESTAYWDPYYSHIFFMCQLLLVGIMDTSAFVCQKSRNVQ